MQRTLGCPVGYAMNPEGNALRPVGYVKNPGGNVLGQCSRQAGHQCNSVAAQEYITALGAPSNGNRS
jgi:hypothetical protein